MVFSSVPAWKFYAWSANDPENLGRTMPFQTLLLYFPESRERVSRSSFALQALADPILGPEGEVLMNMPLKLLEKPIAEILQSIAEHYAYELQKYHVQLER